jgi:hypothetical protein
MRGRATLDAAHGDHTGVEDARKGAIGLFRELENPFWTAVTLYEHVAWLLDRGRAADAEPFAGDARAIFTSLQAQPWLARLDALGVARSTEAIEAG